MSLHATTPRRDHILVYGRPNSGKSSTWINVADYLARTESPAHIYVGSTDQAWDAMRYDAIEPYVTVTDLDRTDFLSWIDWAKTVRSKVTRDDIVVVDLVDAAWDTAQEYYWERLTGGDMLAEVYFRNQQVILKTGEGEAMAGPEGSNWGMIKRWYGAFVSPIVSMPCHVICVAGAKELTERSAPELRNQFKVGWQPAGEKNLPGLFHTILFLAEVGDGWIMSTVRDKVALGQPAREVLKSAKVKSGFVMDYLVPVCGWSL